MAEEQKNNWEKVLIPYKDILPDGAFTFKFDSQLTGPSGTNFDKLTLDLVADFKKDFTKKKFYHEKYKIAFRAILRNLAHCFPNHRASLSCLVAVSKTSQKELGIGQTILRESLDWMTTKDYIYQERGMAFLSEATKIFPKDSLIKQFSDLNLKDFQNPLINDSKLVILRAVKSRKDKNKEDLTYRSNKSSKESKNLLRRHNLFVRKNTYKIEGTPVPKPYLRRIFNGSLKLGGRFYTELQSTPKEKRKLITINDSPVTECDYSSSQASIVLALSNIEITSDLYSIDGLDTPRELIKMIVTRSFYTKSKHRNLYTVCQDWNKSKQNKIQLEELKELVDLFQKQHPELSKVMYSEEGMKYQYLESELCKDIITHFLKHEIPLLPIHDSFITIKKQQDFLLETMKNCFSKRFNKQPLIKIEF